MRRLLPAVAALLVCAAPALAEKTYTAGPVPFTYTSDSVTIDQGEQLTFQNNDSGGAGHDVVSDDAGLFKSEIISPGQSAPVRGVEFLTTGDYKLHCSLHSNMVGTLHVSASGTPQPKPGSAGDKTAPTVKIAVADSKIAPVLKRKGLKVRVNSSEPASFKLTAVGSKRTIARGVAKVTAAGQSRTVTLALTASGKKLLKNAKKVVVKVSGVATDGAGNQASATATRTLRR
jgi:plastocyanin